MHNTMATLALITLVAASIINAFFGLTVLLRTYQKSYGRYFGLTILGVVLWGLSDIGILFATNERLLHYSALVFYLSPMIIPIFIWFFALSFPEDSKLPKYAPILAGSIFSIFAVLFITNINLFIYDIKITDPFNVITPHMPGFFLYAAFFSVFFLLTYAAFVVKLSKLHGLARTQVNYTFWGALAASVPALFSNLSLPMMGIGNLIWLGPFFTLIFAASVTIAIIRHRLFNIRLVLARSIGYLLSVASLAAIYGFVAFLVLNQFAFKESPISLGQQMVYTSLAAGLAFTFYPVRRFFEKITNNLFYRDAYDPQLFIDQLNRSLVIHNSDLDRMLNDVSAIVQSNLKVEFCMFAINDAKGKLRFINGAGKYSDADAKAAGALLPHITDRIVIADTTYSSTYENKLAHLMNKNGVGMLAALVPDGKHTSTASGYLVLGNKKSGNLFTSGDIKLVNILINELVIAIENAMRFEEIAQFNVTLQDRVDDATRKLRRTNDKLKAMDETKDDFISMASHQLRTPLTSIKGYVSMVLDGDMGEVSPAQKQALTQALVSSQRMVFLIADLLNLSRLKTGKFVIEATPTRLADIVESEVNQLQETAKGRELELSYQKPTHFPTLMLDETKIRQVVMNFMDNAIYYTHAGGHIVVELKETEKTVEFTVNDDGIGVPKHEQPHLFNKFYRAGNARKARPDGTGLGLFMAKKVIVAQGGSIIFRSKEGKGSTFGFTLAKARLIAPPNANPVFHETTAYAAAEKSLTS
jgi:signal transduction histidine kinase